MTTRRQVVTNWPISTSCNKSDKMSWNTYYDVNKPSQTMQTHPDVGLLIKLLQDINIFVTSSSFLALHVTSFSQRRIQKGQRYVSRREIDMRGFPSHFKKFIFSLLPRWKFGNRGQSVATSKAAFCIKLFSPI